MVRPPELRREVRARMDQELVAVDVMAHPRGVLERVFEVTLSLAMHRNLGPLGKLGTKFGTANRSVAAYNLGPVSRNTVEFARVASIASTSKTRSRPPAVGRNAKAAEVCPPSVTKQGAKSASVERTSASKLRASGPALRVKKACRIRSDYVSGESRGSLESWCRPSILTSREAYATY